MKKGHRDGARILEDMGLTIVESYRSKHHTFVVRTPDGRTFNVQMPHSTSEGRFWHNWRTQLRRRINGPG